MDKPSADGQDERRVPYPFLLLLAVSALAPWRSAHADAFGAVRYDSARDELVITMLYRGSNPDHAFTLQWGECKRREEGSLADLVATVDDDQFQDPARQDYRKTFRVSLADLACRPAKLTLHTAPRFYAVLTIPARDAHRVPTLRRD